MIPIIPFSFFLRSIHSQFSDPLFLKKNRTQTTLIKLIYADKK